MIKKIKYIIVLFISFFAFNISANATTYINYDSTYTANSLYDYSDLANGFCGNQNFYDFILEFISTLNYNDSSYDFYITTTKLTGNYPSVRLNLVLVDNFGTDTIDFSYFLYSTSSNNSFSGLGYNHISRNIRSIYLQFPTIYLDSNDTRNNHCLNSQYSSYFDIPMIQEFITKFNSNSFTFQESTSFNSNFYYYGGSSLPGIVSATYSLDYLLYSGYYNPSSFNSSSFTFDNFVLPFFQTFNLKLSDTNFSNRGSNAFFKKIYLAYNDITYEVGDILPSYYEILFPVSEQFIEYKPRLGTIYTNFSPQSVNNFGLDISFNSNFITALEYYNNLGYTWNCYGRKNNNNEYYSYEMFPYCDFETFLDSNGNSFKLSVENFNIYDSNDNIITDFSNYDKIFFYLDFQYKNDNLSQVVSNLKLNFTGNVYFEDNFRGPIYDDFYDLPTNFKMFLSTSKKDYSYLYGKYISSNNSSLFSIRRQEYNIYNLGADINPGYFTNYFSRYSVNNALNTGLMVFQSPSSIDEDTFVGLEFVFFQDIIISIRGDSSNSFSYYDNTGTIINSNITIDYSNVPENNYDITYYVSQINDFIDSLTDSSLEFSNITQTLYDGLPFIFQSFIFVIFVLFCTYFTFLLIKK